MVVPRWAVWLPAVAVGLLVVGVIINGTTAVYNYTHREIVYSLPPGDDGDHGLVYVIGIFEDLQRLNYQGR